MNRVKELIQAGSSLDTIDMIYSVAAELTAISSGGPHANAITVQNDFALHCNFVAEQLMDALGHPKEESK
jgi:hypothetical protein